MKFFDVLGKRAFTLAELMAVVIIVSIIAGIGFGSYRKAIDRAKFSDGLSGAHTLAAAYDAYYYDHDYTYPSQISQLAVELSGASVSGSGMTTPNFIYTLGSDAVKAQAVDGDYVIYVYYEPKTGVAKPDRCEGSGDGVDFCKSMGYSCDVSGTSPGHGDWKCS